MAISEIELLPEDQEKEKVHQAWTRVTGKEWQSAKDDGYSDGEYDTNIDLQKKLNEGWNPYSEKEEANDTIQKPVTPETEQKEIDTALASEEPTSDISDIDLSTNSNTTQVDSAPPADVDVADNDSQAPKFKSFDDFRSYIGLDDIPERSAITSEERQKRLYKRNKLNALGEAFKLLVEGGGAMAGSYVDKREPNPWMEKTEAQIQKLQDADLVEQRRIENEKINDSLRKSGMYGNYVGRQEGYAQQDKAREDQKDFRRETATTDQENRKELAGINTENQKELIDYKSERDPAKDKDFLEWKADLEVAKQKEISKARTQDEMTQIETRYDKMYDYQKKLYDEGIKDGASNKGVKINGKTYTDDELDVAVAGIIESGVDLPMDMQTTMLSKGKLNRVQKIMLVKKYSEQSQEESKEPAKNPEWIEQEIKDNQVGGFWTDPETTEQQPQETDIYGNPI